MKKLKQEPCSHKWITVWDTHTIRGTHLHLYRCMHCGEVDYKIEDQKEIGDEE